ncbi:MAG: tyrosine-type recombinase/integrase [Candidatus Peregrinibacteria bacterium]
MTLNEIFLKFSAYLKIERGLSPRTIETYEGTQKLFVRFLGDETVGTEVLTRDLIRQFLYWGTKERNWQPKTYVINFCNFKMFCRYCVVEDYILTNPMETMERPKLKSPIMTPLTQPEVCSILHFAFTKSAHYKFGKYRNYAMFHLALHSGLRLSEILSLTVHDINLEEGFLHVRDGKGGKDRLVALTRDLLENIVAFQKIREKSFANISTNQLFCSTRGNRFNVRDFHRVVELAKKETGITFSAHDFRRTYATTLSRKGVSPFIIQQQLGHSNIKTTMKYVIHNLNDQREAVKNLTLY